MRNPKTETCTVCGAPIVHDDENTSYWYAEKLALMMCGVSKFPKKGYTYHELDVIREKPHLRKRFYPVCETCTPQKLMKKCNKQLKEEICNE